MVRALPCGGRGWEFESPHPPTPNMFYVYIIQSLKNGGYYIGSTSDINRRLIEHNQGKNISTRNKGPFKLVYSEEFESRQLALEREYKIKSYKGGNAFKKLLNIYVDSG